MISNIMLIYGLYKTNRKLTLTKKLFVYLSCVDLILIIVSFAITTAIYYGNSLSYDILIALTSTSISLGLLSFEIFWTICYIRYLSIKKPFLQINGLYATLALLLELLCTISYGIAYFISTKQRNIKSMMALNVFMLSVYLFGLPFVLTLNLKACKTLHFCRTQSIGTSSNIEEIVNNGMNPAAKYKENAAKTLFIVSIFYLICNLPLSLFTFLKTLEEALGKFTLSPNHVEYRNYILWVMLINTGINATIYILRIKEIRCFYKSILQWFLQSCINI